jgi:aminoglycoside phosphotransferase (APT) family kinase protein
LSALHAVDPALLVSEKETPRQAESEVEYWRPTMEATDPTLTSRGPELHDLLMSHTPDAIAPVVVHGDFRLGNILFERADLTGLVDWEIWSIGDPRIDLGWLTTFTEARDFPGAGFEAPGMPRAGELVSVYEGSVGPLGDLRWFAACARYKMAAILGHNIKRHRDGRYHDPYQERLAMAVTSLIDQGIDFVQGRRALD